jgi:hypothetical protein
VVVVVLLTAYKKCQKVEHICREHILKIAQSTDPSTRAYIHTSYESSKICSPQKIAESL